MSKIKKVLALVLAMAMIMAMSIVSFAKSTDTDGVITVSGLAKENTKVSIYEIITLQANDNGWQLAENVPAEAVNLATNPVTIDLTKLNPATLTLKEEKTTNTGSITFNGLKEGAYLVIANSQVNSATAYNKMVGVTYKYNETTGLIEGKTASITAKSSTIDVTKEASTNFVGIGTEVTFTIRTLFPSFYDEQGNNASGTYSVVDYPVGMTLDQLVSVKVGTDTVVKDTDYTVSADLKTVEFESDYIGSVNAHAGEPVEITYKGTVTDGGSYTNSAQAFKGNTSIGGGQIPDHYTGTIVFTKYGDDIKTDDDGTVTSGTKLVGAEFTVKEVMEDDTEKTLYFVATGDGIYKQVVSGTEGAVTQVVVASEGNNKGTVSLTYMEAGNYEITEVVAPDGYQVDSTPKRVSITADETKNVTATAYMTDTKLASLPSTGGIGTTIFTVVGCLIMIAAAAMFFVSRRRTEK